MLTVTPTYGSYFGVTPLIILTESGAKLTFLSGWLAILAILVPRYDP